LCRGNALLTEQGYITSDKLLSKLGFQPQESEHEDVDFLE